MDNGFSLVSLSRFLKLRKFDVRFVILVGLLFVAPFTPGCGGGSSVPDLGGDIVSDAGGDAGIDVPRQDSTDDRGIDVAPDSAVVPDTGDSDAVVYDADVVDDTDICPNDCDSADAGSEVVADVHEFEWPDGCQVQDAVAPWTKIEDDTFMRGPFIQMADRDGATIVWMVAERTDQQGCVNWSVGDRSGTECGLADANGQYEVRLSGLPSDTEITYSAGVGETRTVDLTFRTMPDVPRGMKFLVYADAHNTVENLQKMSEIALAEGVEFGICVGDVAHEALPEEYTQYFDGVRSLASRVNLWAVPGNHDDKNVVKFFESFVLPQGSTDPYDIKSGMAEAYWDRRIGNMWIGGGWVRDFYISMPDSDWGEVGFFRQRFESRDFGTATWKLFFIHQPAWVIEWPGCDYNGEQCLQTAMIPMLRDAGVQASFHGHMHGVEYGVVDGVNTFIIGGVGGGLDAATEDDQACPAPEGWFEPWFRLYGKHAFGIVETGCDRMVIRIVSVDNELLHTIEVPISEPAE